MKKLIIFFSALALIGSCAKVEVTEPVQDNQSNNSAPLYADLPKVIYASVSDESGDDQTRTYVDGKSVKWHSGESISYYAGTYGNVKYTMKEGLYDGTVNAEFVQSGEAKYAFVEGEAYGMPKYSLAVYPYDETQIAAFNSGKYYPLVKYAKEQAYAPNSFGKGANIMVATGSSNDDANLYFRHACGYLVIKLYGVDTRVTEISLTPLNEGKKISGAATLKVEQNNPVRFNQFKEDEAYSTVTLDCSNGGQGVALGADAEHATEFWFALPPITIEGGFQITVTDADGYTYTKQTTKDIQINRNEIQPMKAFAIGLVAPPSDEIWYTQAEGVNEPTIFENEKPFDANITEHFYNENRGVFVIKFDAPVKVIKEKAFENNTDILDIVLPEGLETIENYAFAGTKGEFNSTSLRSINIPGTVNTIKNDVFCYNYSLKNIKFEPSPTNTPLTIGYIPGTLTLYEVGPLYYTDLDRLEINRNFTYTHNPDATDEGIFSGTTPNEIITGEQFTVINKWMFGRLALNFNIPSTITEIQEYAFAFSTMTKVTIPSSVQTIGKSVFFHCRNIEEVVIEDSEQTLKIGIMDTYGKDSTMPMEAGPFSEGPLQRIYLGRNVEFLDNFTPDDGDEGIFTVLSTDVRTSVTIGSNVTSLAHSTFMSCPVTSITIPASVQYIGDDAFYNCQFLNTVNIEDSNTELQIGYSYEGSDEYGPFYDSPLTNVYLGRDIIQVDDDGDTSAADGWEEGVFSNFKYKDETWETTFSIGNKVTKITDYMFSHTCVKYLYIYPAIESIGKYAFYNCEKFQGLSCNHTTPPTLGENAFEDCDNMWYIKVPGESIESFQNADGWSEFNKNNKFDKNYFYKMEE